MLIDLTPQENKTLLPPPPTILLSKVRELRSIESRLILVKIFRRKSGQSSSTTAIFISAKTL
jgi:hypothetical protein